VVAVVASLAAPMARAIKTRASAQLPHARTRLPLQAQALYLKPSPVAALINQRPQAQALFLKPSPVAALISQRPQAQALCLKPSLVAAPTRPRPQAQAL